jgi:hypothetical protein
MTTKWVEIGITRHFQILHVDIISNGGAVNVDFSCGNDRTQGINGGWVALRLACGDLVINTKTDPRVDGINGMTFRSLIVG